MIQDPKLERVYAALRELAAAITDAGGDDTDVVIGASTLSPTFSRLPVHDVRTRGGVSRGWFRILEDKKMKIRARVMLSPPSEEPEPIEADEHETLGAEATVLQFPPTHCLGGGPYGGPSW